MSEKNIFYSPSLVSREERERAMGQKGCVIWLTGFSGSGKSTIGKALERRLIESGVAAYLLDGDNIRHGLNADLGFSDLDRAENIRRIGEVAALFADAGLVVVTAFISPFRSDRAAVRGKLAPGRFIEVFLSTPLDTCERRDPKKLYERVRRGDITDFTGISSPYEPPERPEIELDTGAVGVDDCVKAIIGALP